MKHALTKEVASEGTIARENLPFPAVLYSRLFFGFKKDEQATLIFLCACSLASIENYLRFRTTSEIPQNFDRTRMFVLDSLYFPRMLVEGLMKRNIAENEVIKELAFEEKLCHECNRTTPSYRYCNEMYGGAFRQNYGWYIMKQAYEWGIEPVPKMPWLPLSFLPELCPEDLLLLLNDSDFTQAQKRRMELVESKHCIDFWNERDRYAEVDHQVVELKKKIDKHRRKIRKIIENEVRRKFGHKEVGEAWTSETILYYIVKKLFPKHTIRRHYRPEFLGGLELDIFIEELRIGMEYQGIQHFKPINYWGGKGMLEKLKERDRRKRRICASLNIPIVYFRYNEGLNEDNVLNKVKAVLR